MKRFLLFAGDKFYPLGGWADFKGSFDTEAEAVKAAAGLADVDWIHVVDFEKIEICFQVDRA